MECIVFHIVFFIVGGVIDFEFATHVGCSKSSSSLYLPVINNFMNKSVTC